MPKPNKELIRAIGIDDGHFTPRKKGKTKLAFVLLRADNRLEGILSSEITVDGADSTKTIIKTLSNSCFLEQARCIFLEGINFAGFNMADAQTISKKTGLPVIIVFRKQPGLKGIEAALKKFKDSKKRISLLRKAGKIHKAEKIFFQCHGISGEGAREAIRKFTIHSNFPEPVRIAHLVASAVTLGRSTSP
ncbi:MAG: DUF99 family protein [Candidatus Diapherotrites archaeon]|nr:DUF99 family protein [Candidatus Diapherotrites archaeon]